MARSPVDRPARDPGRPRHRRERDAYRFAEVVPDARLALLDGLATASGALLVGTVLGFLCLLGITLMGGELVPGAGYEAEEVLRSTIGRWVLVLAVVVLLFVPTRAAATLGTARVLLQEGRPATDVPPRSVRRRVAGSNPPGALAGLAWTVLALALLAGGLVAPFAMDHDDPARTPTIAVAAVAAAGAGAVLLAVPGLRAGWAAAQETVRTTWGPNEVRFAESAERRRRAALGPQDASTDGRRRAARNSRAAAVLGGTGLVGFVLFMVGATMRHPRRHGPDEHYGPVGETAIDVLVGVGGALVGAALLLGALWLVAPGARENRRRREALTALRSTGPSAPPCDDVLAELLAPWTGPTVLALVWLVGVGLTMPSVLAAVAGSGLATVVDGVPWPAVSVALAASALGATALVVRSGPRAAARRVAVRARWHPGDDDAS
ncbi:hypothetical protein [Cellulosimicrobium protaetiae]|uniref:Uncharacterized protein n=1 Tax=Cellulosimicrobium protaetiae TaxID=2587808 RepID=A0A6M5UKL5_9MICO|nr:hypothetical protein [Cellulosimicrobium protaetiae]QJW37885.1 hypothetical protein FIC82_018635 [Cellulosimicrobium protaetiae]